MSGASHPLPLLVVVTGPTASGKSALAMDLARHYGCDIISADSRQIYRDIPIGTAAPTPEDRAQVRHHFVGTLGLDRYYSAACFERDVLELLPGMWRKSPVAIMCGGSMMYVDAVTRGIDDIPTISEEIRRYVLTKYDEIGPAGIAAMLETLDPTYYAEVDLQNPRRVIHAVEVCLEAGKPYSELRTGQAKPRPFRILKMMIDLDRETLFERINRRVDAMMAEGLEDEARQAFAQGDFNSLNTVGYKELRAYFNGEMDRETAVARIGKNTRVYAKKQLTWLKKDPDIHRLTPPALPKAVALIDRALGESES